MHESTQSLSFADESNHSAEEARVQDDELLEKVEVALSRAPEPSQYLYETETISGAISATWTEMTAGLLGTRDLRTAYDEFYLGSVEYAALVKLNLERARRAALKNEAYKGQRFFQKALRYEKQFSLNNSAAIASFNGNIDAAATFARGIYEGSKASALFGSKMVMGPAGSRAVDTVFDITDFAVESTENGFSAAMKELLADKLTEVIVDHIPVPALEGKTLTKAIEEGVGETLTKYKLRQVVQEAVSSPEFSEALIEFTKKSAEYAVVEITKGQIENIIVELLDYDVGWLTSCGSSFYERAGLQIVEASQATGGGYSFEAACQAHDACYSHCGMGDRVDCDKQLLKNAKAACTTARERMSCLRDAYIFFAFVSGFGAKPFEEARKICAGTPSTEGSVATALIIDRSASMIGHVTGPKGEMSKDPLDRKKLQNAKQAAKAFATAMDEGDMVSVSSFSESAGTQAHMSVVAEARVELDERIDSITAESSTNIAAGLEEAFRQLNQADNAVNRIAILLSDGENTGPPWQPVVQRFRSKGWPVCTIGFGSRSGQTPLQLQAENALREIARETGCVYDYAETSNVVSKYQELSAHAMNRSVVLSASDILGPPDRVTYPFSVSEGADSFAVMSSWQGSKLGITLTGPQGELISTSERIPEGVEYDEGETYLVLKVPWSQGGQWQAEVDWLEPPEEPEQIHVSVSERSNVYVRMHGLRPRYERGDSVIVSIQAAEVVGGRKVLLHDASVHADIVVPGRDVTRLVKSRSLDWEIHEGIVSRNTRTLTLRDDGRHGDYDAGDGIYAAVFRDTKYDGLYIVKVTVRGRSRDGNFIEKAVQGYFQVGDIRNNAVTSSETFGALRQMGLQGGAIGNQTPYSESVLTDPMEEIEELQGHDPANEIEQLLQQ